MKMTASDDCPTHTIVQLVLELRDFLYYYTNGFMALSEKLGQELTLENLFSKLILLGLEF